MITIFTPTYNRAHTLWRAFQSLQNQTNKNFEWILIDDGSNDNTDEVVQKIREQAVFPFIHKKQLNSGKHIAHNNALTLATKELFCVLDSDDEFEKNAVEQILTIWSTKFANTEKLNYSGFYVGCRLSTQNNTINSTNEEIFVANEIDLVYKYKLVGDRCAVRRTSVLREFLFPSSFKGYYYPEGIIWKKIGAKYRFKVFERQLYIIHFDSGGSIMRSFNAWKKDDAKYVIEIAIDHLNNYFKYIPNCPKLFMKQGINLAVFSFYSNEKWWKTLTRLKWYSLLFVSPFFFIAPLVILYKKF